MKAKLLSVAVALVALAAAPAPAIADSGGGSGGAGGFQAGLQSATTDQAAAGIAVSDQNAVNANVPVSVAGGDVNSGDSSANQTATSTATTDVSNKAKTDQDQTLKQDIGGNDHCFAGCGGAGGFQAGVQAADTNQWAAGISKSDQNAVNANVPVSVAGGDVNSGDSSANQTATSTATTDVSNKAKTDQDQTLKQDIGSDNKDCHDRCDSKDGKDGRDGKDGKDGCHVGCGGAGGFQLGVQKADTEQWALGVSKSDQNAVNANVPVSVAGGDVNSGDSSANQTATSTATTDVSNKAKTDQDQTLKQDIGGNDHCFAGCGGAGGFQAGVQLASTEQWALGVSKSDQNAVNANTPVSIAGGNVSSGPSSANQTATSTATTDVSNKAKTDQDQTLKQDIGSDNKDCHDRCDGKDGRDGKDGKDGCHAGCGGAGGFQLGIQAASTEQWAFGIAKSDQNAVNSNAPHSVAGGNIYDGPSSANQTATSTASTDVSNRAKTDQNQWQWQRLG